MIKLFIHTDNAAFEDGYKELEAARIITEAADKVKGGQFEVKLYDINGNAVGRLTETDVPLNELEPRENDIVLEIKTDNAAFEDDDKGWECARILSEAARKLREGETGFSLRDINGNTVGRLEQRQIVAASATPPTKRPRLKPSSPNTGYEPD